MGKRSHALASAPFHLAQHAVRWVEATRGGLTLEQKLAQLIVVQSIDSSRENLERFAALGIGGLFCRAGGPIHSLRTAIGHLQSHSRVPALICGDLELGAEGAIGGIGTVFPNQMTVAATGDTRWAERMARIAAREGRAAGFNCSFSPVSDLALNHRNALVSTRSFGDNAVTVAPFVAAYIRALQRGGVAACVKHWPGDGWDDRNQHFVTTRNGLSLAQWEATYGHVYRSAIRAGTLAVMSAHVSLPAFRGAGEAPASLSAALNVRLLRERLGFRGVIFSDASTMGGVTSLAPRPKFVPQIVANGCDLLLFSNDPELDLHYLREAVRDGRLAIARVDEAVTRILALKAALGLWRTHDLSPAVPANVRHRHEQWARDCARHAVTLVKDEQRLLPFSPRRHRRVLLIQEWSHHIPKPNAYAPELELERRLVAKGFRVERFAPDTDVHRDYYDVVIYAIAEEASKVRASMELRWLDLQGGFPRAMDRYWHDVPTVFISFGSPFHLRDVPACPTFINAYSLAPVVQDAVVQALVGAIPFRGRSPVRLSKT
ncbi:glycoside hydrolase [Opitutaceae bacterium EW11]|nr:glycoside hydrolase [Opitutaceae bacterium EW11]